MGASDDKTTIRLQKNPKHITQPHSHVTAPVKLAISSYHVQHSAVVPSDLLQGICGWVETTSASQIACYITGPWLCMIYDDGL